MEGVFLCKRLAIRLYGAATDRELFEPCYRGTIHLITVQEILERIRLVNEETEITPLMEQKHVKLDGTIIDVEAIAVPSIP